MWSDSLLHTPRCAVRKSVLQCQRTEYGFPHLFGMKRGNLINTRRTPPQTILDRTFRIGAQSLYGQRTAAILHQQNVVRIVVRLHLLQLVDATLCRMPDGVHVAVSQSSADNVFTGYYQISAPFVFCSPEEVHGRIGQTHFGRRSVRCRLRHVLIARRHHLLGQHALQHPIQMAGFHLPHVHRAVRAANDQEVIQRSPLDADHGEQMSGAKHDLHYIK